MKYLLTPIILLLVSCQQSNTPSELSTDRIAIEMGGVYYDMTYDVEYQTTKGDAYIFSNWNGDEPIWDIMQGSQYKHPNRNDFGAYVFAIGVTNNYYYFNSLSFKVLRNPTDNQVDNGLIYRKTIDENGNQSWEIIKGSRTYYYDPEGKTFLAYTFSSYGVGGWSYSW